jgi:hypothetical protein
MSMWKWAMIGLSVALLLFPKQAYAQCNPFCVNDLGARGAAPWDIQRICCSQFNAGGVPLGNVCYTQFSACRMYQPVPVGSPCYCPTPMGPAPGQVGR